MVWNGRTIARSSLNRTAQTADRRPHPTKMTASLRSFRICRSSAGRSRYPGAKTCRIVSAADPRGCINLSYHIKGVHLPGGVCHISRAKQSSISSTHTRVNKRPPSSYEPTGQTPRRSKPVRSPQKSHDHHTTILTLAPALSSSRTSPTTSRPRNSSSYSANSALCARSARALRTTQKAQPLSSTRM